MKAIILAGGEGTRLRPLTNTIPKPLIPVQGRTLTEHVFDILKTVGVDDVTLSVSYLADQIKDYFGDGSKFGMRISYLHEPKRMGTAGPLLQLKRAGQLPTEDFLLVNGDNLFALDLPSMVARHKESGAAATIALTTVENVEHYGVADLSNGKIIRFVEKPARDQAPSNFVSSGYYIASPEIFAYVPDVEFAMLEHNVFPIAAAVGKLHGFTDEGQWFDTGTPERYAQVQAEWRGPRLTG